VVESFLKEQDRPLLSKFVRSDATEMPMDSNSDNFSG